jgi:hypothetical protein
MLAHATQHSSAIQLLDEGERKEEEKKKKKKPRFYLIGLMAYAYAFILMLPW